MTLVIPPINLDRRIDELEMGFRSPYFLLDASRCWFVVFPFFLFRFLFFFVGVEGREGG